MVDDLANCIPSFPSQAHQVSCFAHVVNLVAKSLLRQFDTPKKANGNSGNDEGDIVLTGPAEGIDLEDAETRAEETELDASLGRDNTEGLINVLAGMDTFK